jgi:hypothetical protein
MPFHTCPECMKGLDGIEGHGAIVIDRYPARGTTGKLRFKCSVCGTEWKRKYSGGGRFKWEVWPGGDPPAVEPK